MQKIRRLEARTALERRVRHRQTSWEYSAALESLPSTVACGYPISEKHVLAALCIGAATGPQLSRLV